MYCEYLKFYFPIVCYLILIWLLQFCHDSDHSFSFVFSLLTLSLRPVKGVSVLCVLIFNSQTSDISGSCIGEQWEPCLVRFILDSGSISLM